MDGESRAPEEFEIDWRRVESAVKSYCRWLTDNSIDAEDLYQHTALRAWQGYSSFRGESKFLTWVLRIADNESYRMRSLRTRLQRHELPLQEGHEEPVQVLESEDEPLVEAGWIHDAVRRACAEGALSPVECDVLLARLADPESSWRGVGARLGLDAATCAVVQCRAVPKLRVFLLQHRQDLFGGSDAVAEAFERACRSSTESLDEAEREVFDHMVLQGRTDYHRRGWQARLRRACELVVRHLDQLEL